MYWFLFFLGYTKKLHMLFRILCFFNILWIFIQNKNYVVLSAKRQLDTSGKRSHKRLRLATDSVAYTYASEYGSCKSSVDNMSSSFTVPDDAPSTSSNTGYLRTVNLSETLNEPHNNPLLFCLVGILNKTEDVQLLSDSDKLDDKTDALLNDIMSIIYPLSQTMDNEVMMKSPEGCEGWDEVSDFDKSDDETDKKLLEEILKSINSNSQTIDNEVMMKCPEGWDEIRDFDKSDDEVDKKLLDDILKSIGSNSQTMDATNVAKESENSNNKKKLKVLYKDGEYVLPNAISSPLKNWDSITLNQNVSDALHILPEAEESSNNRLENISYNPIECSTENMPSVSGIYLKDVGLQHDTNVENVTTGNVASKEVLKKIAEKIVKRNHNDGDTEAATSSQTVSECKILSSMKFINIELMKSMTKKLIQDCELYKYINMNTMNESIKEIEETINSGGKSTIDIDDRNKGKSMIVRLFSYIMESKLELNHSADFSNVSEIFNSSVIFNACFSCLLVPYYKYFSNLTIDCKKVLLKKRKNVLNVIENFLKMDEPKSSVLLYTLLNYLKKDKFSYIYPFYKSALKSVFCLLEEENCFFKIHKKLKEYHKKLKSLYSFPYVVSKICENKEKSVDAKAQDLKERLKSYVAELNSSLSELQDEQKNLITNVSDRFSNVKEMITFIFLHVGKILIILFNWNYKQKTNFTFLITIFNQLLLACKKYVNCESNINEEISSLLTEKEYLLEAFFGNMFLWIYRTLILQLKIDAENTLKEINNKTNNKTNISHKLNDNEVLKMIITLSIKVKNLNSSMFCVVEEIENKKEQLKQQEYISSKLRKIDDDVRTLIYKVTDKNSATRKKKIKEKASEFEKIIKQFNSVFIKVGIEPLEKETLKQLKEYVQSLQGTSSLSENDN